MRRWMRIGLTFFVAAILRCDGSEVVFVPWPEVAEGTASFVLVVEDGVLITTHGPFSSEGPPGRIDVRGKSRAFVVEVSPEAMQDAHPLVDASSPLESFHIELSPPICNTCGNACRSPKGSEVAVPLALVARVWNYTGDALEVVEPNDLSGVGVWAPIRSECNALEVERQSVADVFVDGPERHLYPLRDGGFLATGQLLVHVSASGVVSTSTTVGTQGWVELIESPDGRYFGTADGKVWEIQLGEEGVRVRARISVPGDARAIAWSDRGLVGATRNGRIFHSVSTDALLDFEVSSSPAGGKAVDWSQATTETRGLAPVMFGGAEGTFLMGDPWSTDPAWQLEFLGVGVDSSARALFWVDGSEGEELWQVTVGRGFHRRLGPDQWEEQSIVLGAEVSGCHRGIDECGFPVLSQDWRGASLYEGDIYFASPGCPGILRIVPELGCARVGEMPDLSAISSPIFAPVRVGDEVFFLGPDGLEVIEAF